jgi:hypothetical protein
MDVYEDGLLQASHTRTFRGSESSDSVYHVRVFLELSAVVSNYTLKCGRGLREHLGQVVH